MIQFKCSRCGKQLKVKDEAAGKRGKCPQCGALVNVPHDEHTSSLRPSPEQSPRSTESEPVAQSPSEDGRQPDSLLGQGVSDAPSHGSHIGSFDLALKIAVGISSGGLLILALSPLFRWINFGAGGVTGITGDGKIVLGVTVVSIILFAVAAFARKSLITVSLGVGAWGTVMMFWMGGLIWKVGSILDSQDVQDNPFAAIFATQISPGAGLYLGLVGGILVAGSLGFLAFRTLQVTNKLHYFYISQICALVLGVVVAIAVGPERSAPTNVGSTTSVAPKSPFSFAERGKLDTRAQRRSQAVEEIERLRAKLAAEKQDVLAKFVVERSRFRQTDTGFMRENVIDLAVRNETGRAVSRAYFRAVLLTPGREMPWVDDEFNYQITGGLEPGESATWSLSPNRFGAWAKAPEDRDDLVLVVRPVRLDGADGASMTGDRFTENDAERLTTLLNSTEYAEANQVRSALTARDEAVRKWRSSAPRTSVRSELEYLRSIQKKAQAARISRARFSVEHARFYFSKDRFSTDPVIGLTVKNGTGQAVSRFYCRGILSSPGRETPWVDDTFNYSVRGGIQPGETKEFNLSPNMFGPWGQAPKDRQDMSFTVTVYRLDGPDGAELYPSTWSEEDAVRLQVLEKMIREQGW